MKHISAGFEIRRDLPSPEDVANSTLNEIKEDLETADQVFDELYANLAQISSFIGMSPDTALTGPETYHTLRNRILSEMDRVMELRQALEEAKRELEGGRYEVN